MAPSPVHLESLADPPHTRKRLLVDVAAIAVAAILCGCDSLTAMHRWAACRGEWLAHYLTLANGIPSRDCIRRPLSALKPEAFQRCFQDWIARALVADDIPAKRLIAIDGKSNEITAILLLLQRIPLADTIVTIDAMGRQKDIVGQVVAGGGDGLIAVRDNRPKLRAALESSFDRQIERDFEGPQYRRHGPPLSRKSRLFKAFNVRWP